MCGRQFAVAVQEGEHEMADSNPVFDGPMQISVRRLDADGARWAAQIQVRIGGVKFTSRSFGPTWRGAAEMALLKLAGRTGVKFETLLSHTDDADLQTDLPF